MRNNENNKSRWNFETAHAQSSNTQHAWTYINMYHQRTRNKQVTKNGGFIVVYELIHFPTIFYILKSIVSKHATVLSLKPAATFVPFAFQQTSKIPPGPL